MKTTTTLICAGVIALASSGIGHAASAEIGRPAPEFTLTDINGKKHTLSEFKGKTVVLEWVNPECPVVGRHYGSGNMQKLQQSAAADGIVWLSINSAAPGKQGDYDAGKFQGWKQKVQFAGTSYFRDSDGQVGRLYDARTTPHMFVIDSSGTLVYAGGIDNNPSGSASDSTKVANFVAAALGDLKAGRPIHTPTSRPYGCGIKY